MAGWTLRRVGDSTLVVEFEQAIDPGVSGRALGVGDRVRRELHPGVRDVVEGYCSVTVAFDPLRTDVSRLSAALVDAAEHAPRFKNDAREITLPVCYGGRFGPDLEEVAEFAGCTQADVVTLHSASTYRVYMLGFLPGFAYMGSVTEQIASPRRQTPRVRVPAGSVGIAGRQTCVYPLEAPGGWQVIGRCPVKIFRPERTDPFLLHAGDVVRFLPVDESEYVRAEGVTVL